MKLFLIVSILVLASCNKEPNKTMNSITYIPNEAKVLKFLSIMLNVSIDSVKVDYSSHEFYVPNTVFKMDIDSAENLYNNANNYKLQYENN